jgi:AcrR family transcriptional regulator
MSGQSGVDPPGVDPPGVDPPGVDPPGVDPPGVDSAGDGRRLRRDRNRMAVVDALLDLYGESNLRPSTAEIADRAGLSHRSLFRYFDDFEDLCREAICRAELRARPLVPIDIDRAAPLADRIEALVSQRLRLFVALGQVAQVSRLNAPFAHVLAAELTKNRAILRAQVADLFAPELNPAPEASPPAKADVAERAGVAEEVVGTDAVDDQGARGRQSRSDGPSAGGRGAVAGGAVAGGAVAGGAVAGGAAVLAAADVLCSFESFHLLSSDQHLSIANIRTVLTSALTALLDRPGHPAAP